MQGGGTLRRFVVGCALLAALLALLLIWTPEAADGVRRGLAVCADSVVPSLFPFFVLSAAAAELGLPQRLARPLGPIMSRLFRVPGAGAAALAAGLLGGYPLGAAAAADLCRRGAVSRAEAGRLLGFCNNSGPAFLIGAAGCGVFGSPRAGLALYACHALAALAAGLLLRGGGVCVMSTPPPAPEPSPGAFARAVASAAGSVLGVCGFVTAFSALCAALDATGLLSRAAGELAARSGLELGAARAAAAGFFELGGGISALAGCSCTRGNFALAALLIGWGGLSVHMQTASVLAAEKISAARHLAGRLLSAVFSAVFAALAYGAAF